MKSNVTQVKKKLATSWAFDGLSLRGILRAALAVKPPKSGKIRGSRKKVKKRRK